MTARPSANKTDREPQPGHYVDSCGTLYKAVLHPKTGWHLQRHQHRSGYLYDNHPFAYPDFKRAVHNRVFTYVPTP